MNDWSEEISDERERKRTIQVIHDLLEALVLPNLINNFLDGIYHATVSRHDL